MFQDRYKLKRRQTISFQGTTFNLDFDHLDTIREAERKLAAEYYAARDSRDTWQDIADELNDTPSLECLSGIYHDLAERMESTRLDAAYGLLSIFEHYLVSYILNHYGYCSDDDLFDFVQTGSMSLLKQLEARRFDPEKGMLVTFAMPDVKHSLYLHDIKFRRQTTPYYAKAEKEIAAVRDEMLKDHIIPTTELIANRTGLSRDTVETCWYMMQRRSISIEDCVRQEEDQPRDAYDHAANVTGTETKSLEDEVCDRLMADKVIQAVNETAHLTDAERSVVRHIFGLDGVDRESLPEYARRRGISVSTARSLLYFGKKKLKLCLGAAS